MKTHCRVCNTTYVGEGECLCPAKKQQESIDAINEILTIARKAGMEVEPAISIELKSK